MLNDGQNMMTYDAENRAVTAADSAYVYDGNGLRVQKCTPNCTSPTTSTVYIFPGAQVADEYDNGAAPGSPSREYVYSGGTLLAKIEAGATNYYHPDQLSNRLLTDSTGNVVGQQGHYPFGELWYPTSGPVTKWLFTSYERDSESGNDYAVARHYVNRFGRFLTPDPLGEEAADSTDPQSWDQYVYVLDEPTDLTDPSGLFLQCFISYYWIRTKDGIWIAECASRPIDFTIYISTGSGPVGRGTGGGGGGGTQLQKAQGQTKKCAGSARVLQGNPTTIGSPGGFSGPSAGDIPITAGGAAVIPSQWGAKGRFDPF